MRLLTIAIAISVSASAICTASADQMFASPQTGGKALDWCRTYQHNCGKPAADAFCKKQGYPGASSFQKAPGVGNTRTIGDGSVCEDNFCDSFAQITCKSDTASFKNPQVKNTRLDWCRVWQGDCGKPAADAFCQSKGMSEAAAFKKASGLPKTRVISSGQVCEGGQCDGFSLIKCQ